MSIPILVLILGSPLAQVDTPPFGLIWTEKGHFQDKTNTKI